MSIEHIKISNQIQQIVDRIAELNDRIDLTIMNSSEIKKIERAKSKLVKKKDKLLKKLYFNYMSDDYGGETCESNVYDEEWQNDS